MSSPSSEGGFILFWLMVIIAVTMVSVTVITATDVSERARQRIDAAESALIEFDSAIVRFKRESVGKYPGRLWQLAQQPVNGDLDVCGAKFSTSSPNALLSSWKGPYVSRVIEKHLGTPVSVGVANDTLTAYLAKTTTSGRGKNKVTTNYYGIFVRIPAVEEVDVLKLDERFDAAFLSEPRPDTTGQIKWDQPTGNTSTTMVRYYTAVAKVDTTFKSCP